MTTAYLDPRSGETCPRDPPRGGGAGGGTGTGSGSGAGVWRARGVHVASGHRRP